MDWRPETPIYASNEKDDEAETKKSGDPSSTSTPYLADTVTVFQSAPLVWKDHSGKCHPMPSPDFEEEKRCLLDAVKEAETIGRKIELRFEPANTDRLATFLAKGDASPVLHFSSHGHPAYLVMEAEGMSQPLFVEKLRAFIAASVRKPKLAFVSACHSQPAGDAFLAAGINHVVCCRKKEMIRDSAAIIFAQNFYKALVLNSTVLKEAFRIAYQAVVNSPIVADAEKEANKFLLLPAKDSDDEYHNVRIFYRTPTQPRINVSSRRHTTNLPPPPAKFLGREIPMFDTIQALKKTRLVQIIGGKGFGKSSFARAVCDYLATRSSFFEEFFWLSDSRAASDKRETGAALLALYKNFLSISCSQVSFHESMGAVMEALREVHALITIDARELVEQQVSDGLVSFLRLIFEETRYATVMLIALHKHTFPFLDAYSCVSIDLPPLGFRSSALLFGSNCRHVFNGRSLAACSASQFADLLVPKDQQEVTLLDELLSERSFELLTRIGYGVPGKMHAVASSISEKEFDELIRIAQSPSTGTKINPRPTFEHVSGRSANTKDTPPPAPVVKRNIEPPPSAAAQITDDEHTSSSDGSLGFVGVEFSGSNMDGNEDWNNQVIACKHQIQENLKKLLRYGSLGYGDTELQVEHIEQNGMEKAVVRLEREIELHEDLKRKEYGRVRDICRKLAALLKEAGATETEVEKIMIGCAWRGSLELLVKAPSSCLSLLSAKCISAGSRLYFYSRQLCLLTLTPAFLIKGPYTLVAARDLNMVEPDMLLWKQGTLRLLCPTSEGSRHQLLGLGDWPIRNFPYVSEVLAGEYSFLKIKQDTETNNEQLDVEGVRGEIHVRGVGDEERAGMIEVGMIEAGYTSKKRTAVLVSAVLVLIVIIVIAVPLALKKDLPQPTPQPTPRPTPQPTAPEPTQEPSLVF